MPAPAMGAAVPAMLRPTTAYIPVPDPVGAVAQPSMGVITGTARVVTTLEVATIIRSVVGLLIPRITKLEDAVAAFAAAATAARAYNDQVLQANATYAQAPVPKERAIDVGSCCIGTQTDAPATCNATADMDPHKEKHVYSAAADESFSSASTQTSKVDDSSANVDDTTETFDSIEVSEDNFDGNLDDGSRGGTRDFGSGNLWRRRFAAAPKVRFRGDAEWIRYQVIDVKPIATEHPTAIVEDIASEQPIASEQAAMIVRDICAADYNKAVGVNETDDVSTEPDEVYMEPTANEHKAVGENKELGASSAAPATEHGDWHRVGKPEHEALLELRALSHEYDVSRRERAATAIQCVIRGSYGRLRAAAARADPLHEHAAACCCCGDIDDDIDTEDKLTAEIIGARGRAEAIPSIEQRMDAANFIQLKWRDHHDIKLRRAALREMQNDVACRIDQLRLITQVHHDSDEAHRQIQGLEALLEEICSSY